MSVLSYTQQGLYIILLFQYETQLKLTLLSNSVSVAKANECIDKIKDLEKNVFIVNNDALFCDDNSRSLTVQNIDASAGTKNCDIGYYLNGDICCEFIFILYDLKNFSNKVKPVNKEHPKERQEMTFIYSMVFIWRWSLTKI